MISNMQTETLIIKSWTNKGIMIMQFNDVCESLSLLQTLSAKITKSTFPIAIKTWTFHRLDAISPSACYSARVILAWLNCLGVSFIGSHSTMALVDIAVPLQPSVSYRYLRCHLLLFVRFPDRFFYRDPVTPSCE